MDVVETRIAFAGVEYGGVGRYEHIVGRLRGALDPLHGLNARVADLEFAPRNATGLVEYEVDVEILKPVDDAGANGWLLYEIANRGNKLAISRFNNAIATNRFDLEAAAGDGLLMRHGFTVMWSAWQGDVPPGADRLTAKLPIVAGAVEWSREEFIAEASGLPTDEFVWCISADRFVGRLSYPAANVDPALAKLTVRQRERDQRATPNDLAWRYIDERHIEVSRPAGFDEGAIYEFVYQARDPSVMGAGLASIRDVVSFFRKDESASNPIRPASIAHTLCFGASQSGRVLRDFLYEGFNQSLGGSRVFDAVLPVVTGARRSFVNARFAQPGRYSRQHEDHLFPGDQFPFAYATLTDPISGRTDGILDRSVSAGVCPKVIHLDADTELWAGRASLLVTDCTGTDIKMPDAVRVFLAASVPHSNTPPANKDVVQQRCNPLGYAMLLRALLMALVEWEGQGIAPPESRFPSRTAGTLVAIDELQRAFPRLAGVSVPESFNGLTLTDPSIQPPREGLAYPVYIGAVDADGNTVGGVRYPIVTAPVATATGWNLRAKGFAEGDLFNIHGSLIPFARTKAEREANEDPRPSLEERYSSQRLFVESLSLAAAELVRQRLLLQEDADRIVKRAAQSSWGIDVIL